MNAGKTKIMWSKVSKGLFSSSLLLSYARSILYAKYLYSNPYSITL